MVSITSSDRIVELKQKRLSQKQIAFEGTRTDRNWVTELTKENGGALFKTKARQIEEAVKRLGDDNSSDNIKFLLDVAKNLKYGVRSGSELDGFLTTQSNIADKQQKQNINWEALLKSSIEKALSANNTPDKASLEQEFANVFPQKPQMEKLPAGAVWLSVNPTLTQEKEAVKLRSEILSSKEFVDSKDDKNKAEIKKNIDYFLASSEVAIAEKIECLKLLADFVKPEYKIHQQLTDKKVQILSEIINDLVIKTPEQEQLIIKKMSQESHGMCAAISTSRKAMAHEFKLHYVANLMAELNDKPTIDVYDVTDPKNTDKMTLEKANIDYKAAMREGYRIVDAAVTNWMHIADQMGNGQNKCNQYIPWDDAHYGMFRDSHLTLDLDPELKPLHDVLRSVIKIKELLEKIEENQVGRKDADEELKGSQLEMQTTSVIVRNKVANMLATINNALPAKLPEDRLLPIAGLMMIPENVEDKALKIDFCEGPKVKKAKIAGIIKANMPGATDTQIAGVMDKIFEQYQILEPVLKNEKELTGKSSIKSMFNYYEKLFKLAAFDRVRREFEVEVPEVRENIAKELNVPNEKEAVLKALEDQGAIFSRNDLDAIKAVFDKVHDYQKLELKKGDPGYQSDTKVYLLPKDVLKALKSVEKGVNTLKREIKRDYKDLNKALEPYLDHLYTIEGQGSGQFWVGEEGSSGLSGGKYSRLLKQLSGKDQFIESDPVKGLDFVQKGKGGAVTATMVEHNGYSGHAQYVYDVKEEPNIINPITGEVENQRVLYHDNTWGKSEIKHTWIDDAGHARTDYGKGRGGRNGFLLDPTCTQGTPEIELITSTGVNKAEEVSKKGLDKKESRGTEYPMFMDITIASEDKTAVQSAYRMLGRLINLHNHSNQKVVNEFFSRMTQGNVQKIDAFADELVTKVSASVIEALQDPARLKALPDKLEADLKEVYRTHPGDIFKPGAHKELTKALTKDLPQAIAKIMNGKGSDVVKQVSVLQMLEAVVKDSVYEVTNPGEKVEFGPKQSEQFQKSTKEMKEKLMKIIRGKSLIAEGFDPNGPTTKGGIETREDFNALPANHPLKMIVTKMSMRKLAVDDASWLAIDKSQTPEDLDKARNFLIHKQKEAFRNVFMKTKESAEIAVKAFTAISAQTLDSFGQKNDLDVSELKAKIEAVASNVPNIAAGSASKIKKQFETIVNDTVKSFHVETEGKEPEKEAQLKEVLEGAVKATFIAINPLRSIEDFESNQITKNILNWIELKLNPPNDEAFMKAFESIQNMSSENFEKMMGSSTPKDLGVVFDDPFVIVQRLRGLNKDTKETFDDTIANHIYNETYFQKANAENIAEAKAEHEAWLKTPEAAAMSQEEKDARLVANLVESYNTSENATIDTLYRNLDVQFSYINMEKVINSQKEQALYQYGARAAFPVIKPATDEEIQGGLVKTLNSLAGVVVQYGQLKAAEKEYANKPEELAQIKAQTKACLENIKNTQIIMVKGLIRPRHQDDVNKLFNTWIKEFSKDPQSELAQNAGNELVAKMTEDHFLNHPDEFLKHIALETPKMMFNKNKIKVVDLNITKAWQMILLQCLDSAKKAMIEFKTIEKIEEGRMPQIAKVTRDPEMLYLSKGEKGKTSLDSKQGIQFIMSALEDPTNNHSTLKMFIEQNGLTNTAVKMFLEGPAPSKSVKFVKVTLDSLTRFKADREVIQDKFEAFAGKLMEGNKKLSLDELDVAIKDFFAILDESLADKKDGKALPYYKNIISESLKMVKQMNVELPDGDARNLLLSWNEQILQKDEMFTEQAIERIITQMNILQGRMNGLETMSELVPAYSELTPKINTFMQEADQAIKDLDKIRGELQDPILDRIQKQQEAEQAAQAESAQKIDEMKPEELEQIIVNQAQGMLTTLLKAINNNDQTTQQGIVQQIIQTENPMLDNIIIETFKQVEPSIFKTYMAGILAEKGYIDILAEYVEKALDKNGQLDRNIKEDDQALVLAADGLIKGTMTPNPSYNAKTAKVLAKIFKAACDDKNPTPIMDQLLSTFINGLTNKGPAVQKMLVEIISNPEEHINAKTVAIDILGRSDTLAFFGLFSSIIENPGKYVNSEGAKLYVLNVAMKSLSSMAERYQGLPYKQVLDKLQPSIATIAEAAKKEGKYTAKDIDSEVKTLNDRITRMNDILNNKVVKKSAKASGGEEDGEDDIEEALN